MRAHLVYIARGAWVLEALFFLVAGRIIVGKNEMPQMRMLVYISSCLHLLPRPISFLHPPLFPLFSLPTPLSHISSPQTFPSYLPL